MTSELDKVVKIRKELEKITQNETPNNEEVLGLLNTLQRFSMTLELLQRSGIGLALNRLRQKLGGSESSSLAKKLIKTWKKVLPGSEGGVSSKRVSPHSTATKKELTHSPVSQKLLASPKTSSTSTTTNIKSPSFNERTKKPRRKAIKPFLSTLPPRPVTKSVPSSSHPVVNGPSSPPSLTNSVVPSLPGAASLTSSVPPSSLPGAVSLTSSVPPSLPGAASLINSVPPSLPGDATAGAESAVKPAEGEGDEGGGRGGGGGGREGGGGGEGSEGGREGGGVSGECSSTPTTARPLIFPSNVSGTECSPSTGSEVRDRCRELIVRALKKGHDEVTLEEEYKFYNLGAQIEECVFESLGGESGSKYRHKVRSRVANLGDLKNAGLRQQVLAGYISPQQLATMTTQEMASDSLKKLREQLTKEAIRDAQVAQTDGAGGTNCDLLRCPECSKSNCSYTQAQTLASDEPMTTFAYCNDCGNRWIFY